jgi:hypothetical protein
MEAPIHTRLLGKSTEGTSMKPKQVCIVDRANKIQDKWNNADGIGRRAMLKEFLMLPRSFIVMQTPKTGFPVIDFIPVGLGGMPIDLAKETARRFGQRTDVLFYNGRWYSNETLIPTTQSNIN